MMLGLSPLAMLLIVILLFVRCMVAGAGVAFLPGERRAFAVEERAL